MRKIKRLQKGSILVGSILIMLLVSSITIALIFRDKEGAQMAISTESGNSAYQKTDQGVEEMLHQIKDIDISRFGAVINKGAIPENTSTAAYCSGDFSCQTFFDLGGGNPTYVSEIDLLFGEQDDRGNIRKIKTVLPKRVSMNGFSEFNVMSCADDSSHCDSGNYNKCDASVFWKWDTPGDNPAEKARNKIAGFQIRQSKNSLLKDAGWFISSGGDVADNSVGPHSFAITNSVDDSLQDLYSKTYYFAIKAKNDNSLMMDSLYYNVNDPGKNNFLTVPARSCNSPLNNLGCASASQKPLGTILYNQDNTCCGGTECYMPDPDWEATNNKKCTYEKCLAGDVAVKTYTGGVNDGDSTTGWCGGKVDCKEGDKTANCTGTMCVGCQKTSSYCSSEPAKSTQHALFDKTDWVLGAEANVYTGTNYSATNAKKMEAKCAYHKAPQAIKDVNACGGISNGTWSASLDSKAEYNCGPYSATVKCTLSCNQFYHVQGNQLPVVTTYANNAKLTIRYANGNTACRANDCGSLPQHSVYYPNNNIKNIENDNQAGQYSPSDTMTKCEYYCSFGHIWDGSKCK